jgi:hypothetical protein
MGFGCIKSSLSNLCSGALKVPVSWVLVAGYGEERPLPDPSMDLGQEKKVVDLTRVGAVGRLSNWWTKERVYIRGEF